MNRQVYQNILVGIDGSEQATQAFQKAVEVARRNDGKVYVANVIQQNVPVLMGYSSLNQNIVDQETEAAKVLIEECKDYGKSVDFTNIEGIVAYGSAKTAMATQLPEKYDIDLVMVGQSGLNAVERFMTGSVASFVIREAPCDVLVVTYEEKNEKA
ncbi:universal stress protein [Enterococcus canintestini]|uniref:Universal stress protein n=1 Tax=Enterococcus canintestini TaxID=317010 RepID=A0A267HS25_9ENTE|nr:universal stress protein [Enterococcus canintestini]PAB01144.1 universal stress protein UspA [Enterococcus canintestini]